MEDEKYLCLLIVGFVVSHCTIFMHEHKSQNPSGLAAYCFHPMNLIQLVTPARVVCMHVIGPLALILSIAVLVDSPPS